MSSIVAAYAVVHIAVMNIAIVSTFIHEDIFFLRSVNV